ncbi:hypothetical protein E4U14_004253 [Claviceps sp. LM454 group G7]|nr:hypothetical protein E4U14_004253 [Claviceps sp. LM454 group G7]
MELWIFDRSGAYSSGTFDIDREPEKFARDLVSYATMNAEMLGADTFIKRNGWLSVEVDVDGEDRSIKLQKLMAKPPCAIITRGTQYRESEMWEGLTVGKPHKFRLSDLVPSNIPGGASASKSSQSVKSGLGIEYTAISSTESYASSGVAEPDPNSSGKEPWENRIFSCHIISPVGQVIKDFKKQ